MHSLPAQHQQHIAGAGQASSHSHAASGQQPGVHQHRGPAPYHPQLQGRPYGDKSSSHHQTAQILAQQQKASGSAASHHSTSRAATAAQAPQQQHPVRQGQGNHSTPHAIHTLRPSSSLHPASASRQTGGKPRAEEGALPGEHEGRHSLQDKSGYISQSQTWWGVLGVVLKAEHLDSRVGSVGLASSVGSSSRGLLMSSTGQAGSAGGFAADRVTGSTPRGVGQRSGLFSALSIDELVQGRIPEQPFR